jgi:hypothetical protein
MIEKEKAKELIRKYYSFGLNNPAQSFSWYECKQCALIAVDEIIEMLSFDLGHDDTARGLCEYWESVKSEIQLL